MKCKNCPLTLTCHARLFNKEFKDVKDVIMLPYTNAYLCPKCGKFIYVYEVMDELFIAYRFLCEQRKITTSIKEHWENHKYLTTTLATLHNYPMWNDRHQLYIKECPSCNKIDTLSIIWKNL